MAEALPFLETVHQSLASFGGYLVVTAAYAVGSVLPPSFNHAGPLQTVQCRVESPFFEVEVATTPLPHFFDHLVAIHGLQLQQGQEHALGITFEHFLLMHSPLFVRTDLKINCIVA